MKRYLAIIRHEPGKAYGVEFPDVPGCFSAGDTLDEAIENAAEALMLFFEDWDGPLPEPSPADTALDQAAEPEGDETVHLAMIPYLDNRGRSVRANITVAASLLEAIDAEAKRRKLTRSAFLAEAARKEIIGT